MFDFSKILDKYAKKAIDDIRSDMASKRFNATGETSKSLNYEVTGDKAVIRGNSNIFFIIFGRSPSKGGARQGEGLYRRLIPWVETKLGLSGSEARTRAFFISKKIHNFGTQVYRGERKGLETEKIRDNIQKGVREDIKTELNKQIKEYIKQKL